MATLQQIEDGIRKLHAANPKDPRIKVLGEARTKLLAGGGGGGGAPQGEKSYLQQAQDYMMGTLNNFSDPAQWEKAMQNPVVTSVTNPGQSIPDALRTTADFASLGAIDRLRAGLKGTDYAAEKAGTEAADARLGTIDEALNLGTAVAQPSLAAKAIAPGAGKLAKAGLYGAEGAGLAGTEALVKGEDPLPAMAYGGFGGAGGSIAADAAGSVANVFSKNKPEFKTDADLFAAADKAKRNTREGKDIVQRAGNVEEARLAAAEGQQGFRNLLAVKKGYGRKESGLTLSQMEQLTKLAHQGRKLPQFVASMGSAISGGRHWAGKLGMGALTKGIAPAIGTAVEAGADLAKDVSPRQVEKYLQSFRQGNLPDNPNMTPEMIDLFRQYLAKTAAGGSRDR